MYNCLMFCAIHKSCTKLLCSSAAALCILCCRHGEAGGSSGRVGSPAAARAPSGPHDWRQSSGRTGDRALSRHQTSALYARSNEDILRVQKYSRLLAQYCTVLVNAVKCPLCFCDGVPNAIFNVVKHIYWSKFFEIFAYFLRKFKLY